MSWAAGLRALAQVVVSSSSSCLDAPVRIFRLCPCCPARAAPHRQRRSIQVEARAWNDVVDALPSQWIDAAAQMVLRRLVCQIAIAERLEAVCVSSP